MNTNTVDAQLLKTLPVKNILGEGVFWQSDEQALWWTDIQAKILHRYCWNSETLKTWDMPRRVCSFGVIKGDKRIVIAFDSGFALYDLDTASCEWLAQPEAQIPGNRFNDGKIDRFGRFWAGTMVEGENPNGEMGALYCLKASGDCSQHIQNIKISNGLCWSPDSRHVYHADSPTRKIWVYDFDGENGQLSNKQVFAETEPGSAPDGSTVDAEGYIWSAHWGGGRVVRYSPEGKVDFTLKLPVSQPTCVAFGGKDLDLLFVTTASEDLSAEQLQSEPEAGNVFVFKTNVKGLVEPEFILSV